ncbi:hypothetical protein D1007_40335 [Hordeum vulgare]|nr:hypothetical protein D1007_40335 [Hordeum vulgare]
MGALIEEESQDLLSQALTHAFSNLFHTVPNFNFEAAMAPIPEAIRGTLGKEVRNHVGMLSVQFARDVLDD